MYLQKSELQNAGSSAFLLGGHGGDVFVEETPQRNLDRRVPREFDSIDSVGPRHTRAKMQSAR